MDSQLDDLRSPLPPPRFSLATMFWVIGMLAVLLGAMTYLGAYATLLLGLFAAAILAHVAGNALGTKLRDCGDKTLVRRTEQATPLDLRPKADDFAPTTELRDRHALGWPALIATLAGAITGGLLGGVALTLLMNQITVQAVVLAVIASAVLGAIWAFAAASFVQVSFSAAQQATAEATSRAAQDDSAASSV